MLNNSEPTTRIKSKKQRHLDRLHRRQKARVKAREAAGLCGHCGKKPCIKG